jgi:hypothetical protein
MEAQRSAPSNAEVRGSSPPRPTTVSNSSIRSGQSAPTVTIAGGTVTHVEIGTALTFTRRNGWGRHTVGPYQALGNAPKRNVGGAIGKPLV